MDHSGRLEYLFHRYISDLASADEEQELMRLIEFAENKDLLLRLLQDTVRETKAGAKPSAEAKEAILQAIFNVDTSVKPVVVKGNFHWRRWAVAASLALLIGLGAYFLLFNKTVTQTPDDTPVAAVTHDVKPPSTNRATITMADGKVIYLDSAADGQLAMQGNMKLVKLADGQVAYQASKGGEPVIAYNTLTNPRGSKVIDMALSDGSHVWLDAGSSITYPVVFTGDERKVTMNGEAYFEVAHNAAKPFYVSKGDVEVKVLGTLFNVDAYDDEESIKVTLLEGSVRVESSSPLGEAGVRPAVTLRPGQQATITKNQKPETRNNIDLEQVMAWKNGLFQFHNAGLPAVMKQLARWYDVEVVYEGKVPVREFEGKMQRGLTLAQALKILEMNHVHFRIENRKLIVEP